MDNKLFDELAVRLLRAFFSVEDPYTRTTIVELVESAADDASLAVREALDQIARKLN
jgi:hypothetical protein